MERYTRTAMVLHWLIALAIVAQIGFGWSLTYSQSPAAAAPRGLPPVCSVSTTVSVAVSMTLRLPEPSFET